MVIVRFVSHGFCHSLQFQMTVSTFSLKVSVEFLESIEPRLELGDEVEFFVMSSGTPGQCPSQLQYEYKVLGHQGMILYHGAESLCSIQQSSSRRKSGSQIESTHSV